MSDVIQTEMEIDQQTLLDLDVFESATGQPSLFEYCNLAKSEGGARILRKRMQHPWSDPERIRDTQLSIAAILAQPSAFQSLPSAFTTGRVTRYLNEILPIVTQQNTFEFGLASFTLWANHPTHYLSIARGVTFTWGLTAALRRFLDQPELATVEGELSDILGEMRELLEYPFFQANPKQGGIWKTLRADQQFRLSLKVAISRLLELIYQTDALVALAEVTRRHNLVLPEIETGELRVSAEGLYHPLLKQPVTNPVELDQSRRLLFLTGPNMAGKTTYLRAFATAVYFAHLGMGVPASRFRFVPAQSLFTSISLADDLRQGVSYFRAEALRVKAVAEAIARGRRVVAVMDEPFKGTNVKDAYDASLAILSRLARRDDCLFMFSSHLIELRESLTEDDGVDCRYFEAEEGGGRLRFDYQLRRGVSSQRLGMRVLAEEGVFMLLDGES